MIIANLFTEENNLALVDDYMQVDYFRCMRSLANYTKSKCDSIIKS